jgi:two-component system chemotaxis sensor kinase CheA
MMRSKKMVPNAEITNLLLTAFDQLREMINHPKESADADINELLVNLTGLTSSYLPQEQKASLTQIVTLEAGQGSPIVMPKFDFDRSEEAGRYLCAIEYDLIHDIERQGRNILEVFHALSMYGELVDCELNFEAVGTLDGPIGNQLPVRLILSTEFKPDEIVALFPYNQNKIKLLSGPSVKAPTVTVSDEAEPPRAHPAPVATVAEKVELPHANPAPATAASELQPNRMPAPPLESSAPAPAATKSSSSSASAAPTTVVEDSIRVNVATLEMLMNLAGELVLGRNQLRASIAQKNPRALKAADQRINQITSELQDVVMQTRLQPIGNVFGKFPRLVRDLASNLHKDIQLDIRGKDVALDRSLIESLSDPLTHMVRNAVDHGIETPEDRARAGKNRQGSLSIDARHEAGQVVVEIADDGKGIDPERIGKVALGKGLITAEKLDAMSAKDKTALIFLPGLSTNTQVSDVSGRGVGMDVVKTNLDRLGGKVEIISTVGKGTTFRIKLPLTLAIIPSLIVSVEGERFAIPQINVEEMRHVLPDQAKTRIEIVGDAEVLVLRDRLIPLVRFADLLGLVPTYTDPNSDQCEIDRRTRMADRRSPRLPDGGEKAPALPTPKSAFARKPGDRRHTGGALEIVVVTTGSQTYGLVVGGFQDTEEIVVKPLGSHLKGLEEYAGATILGDGSVALILDVAGLAAKAHLDAIAGMSRVNEQNEGASQEQFSDSHSLVLFHNGPEELCALPLDTVTRIEHIAPKQVEMIGGRRTMQYHGGLLPLVTLSDSAQVKPIGENKELAVMIANVRSHEVGLLGAMPVDVIETGAKIDQTTHRQKGVSGSAIIRDQTALIVDLYELVDAAWPEWAAEQASTRPVSPHAQNWAVLLAEDSDFFRTQITHILEEGSYPVLAAPDGEAAWELLLENLDKVRTVVTDIEMPRLDGLGLARRIRGDSRTAHLPIVALTSLAGEDDMARGKAAGIDDYQTKLDRDQLLERLREYSGKAPAQSVTAVESYAAA